MQHEADTLARTESLGNSILVSGVSDEAFQMASRLSLDVASIKAKYTHVRTTTEGVTTWKKIENPSDEELGLAVKWHTLWVALSSVFPVFGDPKMTGQSILDAVKLCKTIQMDFIFRLEAFYNTTSTLTPGDYKTADVLRAEAVKRFNADGVKTIEFNGRGGTQLRPARDDSKRVATPLEKACMALGRICSKQNSREVWDMLRDAMNGLRVACGLPFQDYPTHRHELGESKETPSRTDVKETAQLTKAGRPKADAGACWRAYNEVCDKNPTAKAMSKYKLTSDALAVKGITMGVRTIQGIIQNKPARERSVVGDGIAYDAGLSKTNRRKNA